MKTLVLSQAETVILKELLKVTADFFDRASCEDFHFPEGHDLTAFRNKFNEYVFENYEEEEDREDFFMEEDCMNTDGGTVTYFFIDRCEKVVE